MESKIFLVERVENKQRKFGANMVYFPSTIRTLTGDEVQALFTKKQIEVAIKRAEKNTEDFDDEKAGFWSRIFG